MGVFGGACLGAVMGPFGGILLARIWEMRSRDGILGDTS